MDESFTLVINTSIWHIHIWNLRYQVSHSCYDTFITSVNDTFMIWVTLVMNDTSDMTYSWYATFITSVSEISSLWYNLIHEAVTHIMNVSYEWHIHDMTHSWLVWMTHSSLVWMTHSYVWYDTFIYETWGTMGWLQSAGSIKSQVSFAE